jgi:hypothetical protein
MTNGYSEKWVYQIKRLVIGNIIKANSYVDRRELLNHHISPFVKPAACTSK